jgi:hypothetical protein
LKADSIAEVGIDAQERLYVRPAAATFPYIYREAREVHWEPAVGRLHSPKPREWSYARWFQQIIEAADAYGQPLRLTASTVWVNIPNELKTEVERIMASHSTTPSTNEV